MNMVRSANPVLFVTMYPLDALDRAPKVRSYHLWRELSLLVPTTLVKGGKARRAWRFLALMATGRLFRFRAVYVESSSASASPADLFVFALMRLLRRPLLIYVRDAYPIFARQFPPRGMRQKISYWGWRFSVQQYKLLATKLLFPTSELADLFDLPDQNWELLPPGGSLLVEQPTTVGGRSVAYVGPLTSPVVNLLRESMRKVRERSGPEAKCTVVSSRADWDRLAYLHLEDWCEYRQASRDELTTALAEADICLVALPPRGYYGLTLPVKLFDYMSLGKAIVTTNLPSAAKIVEDEQVGLVSDDDPESFADAIVYLFEHPDRVKQFQLNALEAIRTRHSWQKRAERLVEMMNTVGTNLNPAHERNHKPQ